MGGFDWIGKIGPSRTETESRIQKALETIKARGVKNDDCPRCTTFDWNVDLLDISAESAMFVVPGGTSFSHILGSPPASYLSVLSITCKNCGYTMFHTLNVLEGLRPIGR
jgi:predicted nucleic-acid-binding Zn-ribbon protein